MKSIIMAILPGSLILFLTSSLTGQELLSNGGFEQYYKCPYTEKAGPSFVDGYLVDWYQTLGGRMHHADCYVGDSDFWFYADTDSITPFQGKGITTVLRFSNRITILGNQRDYLMSPLIEPMMADSTYHVSYYVHCNRNYPLIDHFGATFVRDTSDLFVEQDSNGLALYTDDYVGYRDTFLGPDDQWHHIEGCYTAKGGERWIALGHFLPFDEVHWHPIYKGIIGHTGAAFILDEVSVTMASREIEEDHELLACDGEVVQLPKPNNPNISILDLNGEPTDSARVDWPNNYTFIYYDACFGELGTITVESETCYDIINLEEVVCENEKIIFAQLLGDSDLYVVDNDGTQLSSFPSNEKGEYFFNIIHQKYGEVGQIKLEVVECDDCKIYLPNIISLRSIVNNTFSIKTKCKFEQFEISIYDRWGNLHYNTNEPASSWSPQNVEAGVYVYIIKYKFLHPLDIFDYQIKTGTITILK